MLSGGFAVRGPWFVEGLDARLRLEPGDVAVLNRWLWLTLRGGDGDGPPTRVVPGAEPSLRLGDIDRADADHVGVGGRVDFNPVGG